MFDFALYVKGFIKILFNHKQVGVISWGLKDKCAHKERSTDTKDFHTNLFSPEVQSFLKEYLGNEDLDPLHFL